MTARGSKPDVVPSDDVVGSALRLARLCRRLAEHRTWRPVADAPAVRETLRSLGWSVTIDDAAVEGWLDSVRRRDRGPALIRAGHGARDWPVRLSGTENRHKAVQKSHAEVGFLSGLRPPFLTVSGSEKSYRPRKLRWRQISGERWERSSSRTSMPSLLNCWMASCM
jgi:hypothetical protein